MGEKVELTKIGFSIAIYPITTLLASTKTIQHALNQLRTNTEISPQDIASFSDLHDISGLDEYLTDARVKNS